MNLQKATIKELNHLLGNIDIYLLDQILKGRFKKNFKILDAGCGEGRNIIYLLRSGYNIFGLDKNEDAINMLKYLVQSINPNYPKQNFQVGDVHSMPFKTNTFQAIISSAVLHFAENEQHFLSMLSEHTRILKSDGLFFIRMATEIGMEQQVKPIGDGKHLLPDGSVRFLFTRALIEKIKAQYEFVEPLKIVMVDGKRCMSTLVLRKM